MKDQNVRIALILAVAMVISAAIVSSALKSFGTTMQKAAVSISNGIAAQRPDSIPSNFRIDLGEIKITNGGGAAESFRITHKPAR